ncbi:electron transport complex subunit RsxB [Hydrogenophaga sp.]|uniref:electron transport complex subunit RsxB n=1 Tax=Hydrogenophaga sp. TaxID=1904254 RepID=UPI002BCE93B3|nr:electron transport complex subunit RsxB [Hydrogenophaga sp.]HMP11226.1 electron transport complex subunit RsxB [Hydrogenophaga sp.]
MGRAAALPPVARTFAMDDEVTRIDLALPQTQCTRCGYPDCAAYAHAIGRVGVPINRCPPGGTEGIARLSLITGQPVQALDPSCGVEGPVTVAVIDENWCIGCTLCIKACPTDAIVGTHKRMHTVIEPHCTGCELCIPVCPVDCISLEVVSGDRTGWAGWSQAQADMARTRYEARQRRLMRERQEHEERLEAKARLKLSDLAAHSLHTDAETLNRKRSVIEAALERARARRAQQTGP